MTREPLPVTLISGYLGAGKTTLVNHLLRNADGRKLLVMVNDFGELPIDADLIEAENGDTLTLANGCICCSMNGDLAGAFMDVLDRDPWPDHLVIEASGVAEPHRIASLAEAEPDLHLNGVVVLSDASGIKALADDPMIGPTIARQLSDADLHLLSKTDLSSTDEVGAVEVWLGGMRQGKVVQCTEGRVPPEIVLGDFDARSALYSHEHHTHEDIYMRWSMQTDRRFDEAKLRAALENLPTGLLRLKGTVCCLDQSNELVVQCVGSRSTIEPRNQLALGESRLVAIGLKSEVSPEDLDELFHSCCEE